jgi:putative two-component system response regulator
VINLKNALIVLFAMNIAVWGLVACFVAYNQGENLGLDGSAFEWIAGGLAMLYFASLAVTVWILHKIYISRKKTIDTVNSMARSLSEVMFWYDAKTEQLHITSNYCDFFDVDPPQDFKRDFIISSTMVDEGDLELFERFKAGVFHKVGESQITIRVKVSSGDYEWLWIVATTSAEEDGTIRRIIGRVTNVNEKKTRYENFLVMLRYDQTTMLYNKHSGRDMVDEFLADENNQNGLHALFSIDIDNFKAINDTFGHSFGDEVLRSCAQRLKETLDEERGDLGCRFGGDEFVVFLPNTTSQEIALKRAEALNNSMNFTVFKDGNSVNISISIGVAFYPINGNNSSELYNKADMAMYSAKNNGKNRSLIYQKSMHDQILYQDA